jgi:hypothetical protein
MMMTLKWRKQMKARELIERLIKLDDLNTEIDFRLPMKFFGEDKDLLLDFNYLFYPDKDAFKDKFTIAFKERTDV